MGMTTYYYYYYYYAVFNTPCVGHKDDESQARKKYRSKVSLYLHPSQKCDRRHYVFELFFHLCVRMYMHVACSGTAIHRLACQPHLVCF